MILDKLNKLAAAQALTATANLTDVIDLQAAGNGLVNGEQLEMVIVVKTAADFTTTDETYTFDCVTSAAAGLTTPTSLGKRTIPASALTVNSKHHIPLAAGVAMLRYLGGIATLAGTTPSVTIDAYIQPVKTADDVPAHYPSAVVVA